MNRLVLTLTILPAFALSTSLPSRYDARDPHVEKSVGESSFDVLVTVADRNFAGHAFTVASETVAGPPTIYLSTNWKTRQPFAGESQQGALQARTRLILRSRGRASRSGEGALSGSSNVRYRIRLRVENQVILDQEEGWTEIDAVEEFEEWAERIADDIEADLRARN